MYGSQLLAKFLDKSGARQGSIMTPYLCLLYVDSIASALRNSGYGIDVGNIFTSCNLYEDNIVFVVL